MLLHCVVSFVPVAQGHEEEYTYRFTEADVAELAAAVNVVKASGVQSETDILKVAYAMCKVTCEVPCVTASLNDTLLLMPCDVKSMCAEAHQTLEKLKGTYH